MSQPLCTRCAERAPITGRGICEQCRRWQNQHVLMLWIFSIVTGLFLVRWVWTRTADVMLTFVAGYGGGLAIYLAIAIGIVGRLPPPAERKRKG